MNTAEAYRDLSPRLTTESQQNKIFSFQSHIWDRGGRVGRRRTILKRSSSSSTAVWRRLKKRLIRAGAAPAMMTGSGSALVRVVPRSWRKCRAHSSRLGGVNGVFRFRWSAGRATARMWRRALDEHIEPETYGRPEAGTQR